MPCQDENQAPITLPTAPNTQLCTAPVRSVKQADLPETSKPTAAARTVIRLDGSVLHTPNAATAVVAAAKAKVPASKPAGVTLARRLAEEAEGLRVQAETAAEVQRVQAEAAAEVQRVREVAALKKAQVTPSCTHGSMAASKLACRLRRRGKKLLYGSRS